MKDFYTYPAVFNYASDGISIKFPDLPGCLSCADNDDEAAFMAHDVLSGWIEIAETNGEILPDPTPADKLIKTLKPNQIISLIRVNMKHLREVSENKAVNKMVTLPKWLIREGKNAGINFSQLLKDALIKELGLEKH